MKHSLSRTTVAIVVSFFVVLANVATDVAAQGAPDVLFWISAFRGTSPYPVDTQSPATSWSHSWDDSAGSMIETASLSGSASGNSLTMTAATVVSGTGSYGTEQRVSTGFGVWVKGRRTVYLS